MTNLTVESVVRDRLGLDPAALGETILPRAIELRMRALGMTSEAAYAQLIGTDAAELETLTAGLVVPESWFFRGGRALFDRLADFIATRAADHTPVRVLSIPCGMGEEPYSLVMALHEHLTPLGDYRIEAVDLSAAHLERARAARYTSFAFRESGPDIRPAYFYPAGDKWDLRASISDAVHFRIGNIFDPGFLLKEAAFDIIICRNLFIYLTHSAKRMALANLDRLLALDGLLCITPAEADRLPPRSFIAITPTGSGLYRRASQEDAVPENAVSKHKSVRPIPSIADSARPPAAPRREVAAVPVQPETFERARALADAGELATARDMCLRLLADQPENAHLHSILGIIHQSEGRMDEAAAAFRKALYLNPEHHEALLHMILICELRGDASQAATLRTRLTRVSLKETT